MVHEIGDLGIGSRGQQLLLLYSYVPILTIIQLGMDVKWESRDVRTLVNKSNPIECYIFPQKELYSMDRWTSRTTLELLPIVSFFYQHRYSSHICGPWFISRPGHTSFTQYSNR